MNLVSVRRGNGQVSDAVPVEIGLGHGSHGRSVLDVVDSCIIARRAKCLGKNTRRLDVVDGNGLAHGAAVVAAARVAIVALFAVVNDAIAALGGRGKEDVGGTGVRARRRG